MGMRLNPELEAQVLKLAAATLAPPPVADEKGFMAEVLRLARRHGWRCYHAHVSRKSEAGWPDLAMVHRAHGLVLAELKAGDGRLTAAQETWLDDLRAVGVRAYEWRPEQWAEIEATLRGDAHGEGRS